MGVYLLYDVVRVSAVEPSAPATHTHISPPLDFLPDHITTVH